MKASDKSLMSYYPISPRLENFSFSPLLKRLLRKQESPRSMVNELPHSNTFTFIVYHPSHFSRHEIPVSFKTPSSFHSFKWQSHYFIFASVPGAERCSHFNISFYPFMLLICFSRSSLLQILPLPIHVCTLKIDLIFL